ncbi:hypothetical protein BJX76DRAFT_325099 [Aspergillus varians]
MRPEASQDADACHALKATQLVAVSQMMTAKLQRCSCGMQPASSRRLTKQEQEVGAYGDPEWGVTAAGEYEIYETRGDRSGSAGQFINKRAFGMD